MVTPEMDTTVLIIAFIIAAIFGFLYYKDRQRLK